MKLEPGGRDERFSDSTFAMLNSIDVDRFGVAIA
jgi:hypothetical protein